MALPANSGKPAPAAAAPAAKPAVAAVPSPAPGAAPAAAPIPIRPGVGAAAPAPAAATTATATTMIGAPKPQAAAPAAAPSGPQSRRLKKGEVLFSEGENSRAMYFIKSGMIRIFKKKGDSNIEIDTIRSGQVLGELAFLDGNPRSASAEALTECELNEISGPIFQETLLRMPDWLKIMLKTVVGRLRTASTRIRQLEQASTAFDYSDKDGKRAAHYVYMSPVDAMKIATGILLVASRNGKPAEGGADVRIGLVQRYVNQIMGVPVAKITTMLDVLAQSGVATVTEEPTGTRVVLKEPEFLEQLIAYLNEENLVEPSKRHDLSPRGFLIMSLMAKHMSRYPKNEATGSSTVNLAEIRKLETPAGGKEPFRLEEFQEMVRIGYSTNIDAKSATEALVQVKPEAFLQAYRYQRVVIAINAVNEQKRKAGGGAK
jgi:CRP/FNR family cyclic AMP-dependent transcriptional regulator